MRLPLTAAQSGIWWGQALDPDSTAYWAAEYVELRGRVDFAPFEAAVARAIYETEALQQRYIERDGLLWQERTAREPFALPCVEANDAIAYMQRDLATPVDLTAKRPFATSLLRIEPELHYWHLRAHHIALDGYGFHLFQRRVLELYRGAADAEPRATLADLVREDQAYRASRSFERDREFWLNALMAQPEPPTLRPARALSRRVLRKRSALPAVTHMALQTAARRLGVDVHSWLCAAVVAFVHARTGCLQQTLGVPVAGRLGSVASSLPCMMMNIVALPLAFEANESFAELARRAARTRRAALPYQRYRYEDLKRDLSCARSGRRLFGAVVNYMPFEPLGAGARKHPLAAGPVEDLAVVFAPAGVEAECRLDLEANPNCYSMEDLEQLALELVELVDRVSRAPETTLAALRGWARAPAELSLLSGAPIAAPVRLLNAIDATGRRDPERIAVEQAGERLSYGELIRRVRLLAGRLRARGVTEGTLVALVLPRSPEAVVAQLATLWLGAAYLPLDPSGPKQRNRDVLEHAQPGFVVTRAWLLAGEQAATVDEPVDPPPSATAYVIYTSGTTGRPNGVVIERSALEHFVSAAMERYAMTARDRVLQFAPLHFDASVEEIMVTLAAGATLVLRTESMLESMAGFLRACREQALSVLDLPTAFFHELPRALEDAGPLPPELRLVIIGGEAALGERVARFLQLAPASVTLLNTYGPTETTVVCSTAELRGAEAAVPIGAPLGGVTLAVVDEQLRLVRRGESGQLCVLGPTLARSYLSNPEATAQRFAALEDLPGAPRAYKTGDRVVLGDAGQLLYLGRLDDELKLSGHRVSPLEVERALLSLPGIEAAAVVAPNSSAERGLIAYVVCAGELDVERLRRGLADHLAPPAIPAHFVALSSLPLDANGKIDRRALRASRAPETALEPLELTPLERVVLGVWREVLGGHVGSLDADFFALGGSSLSALQVSMGLQRGLGHEVPLSALFRHPTIRSLSRALELQTGHASEHLGQDPLAPLLVLQSGRGTPLFCVHPADGLAWCYLGLARELPASTLLALQAPGLTGESPEDFEGLATDYLALVRQAQPHGPYHLLGWSSGGGIAHALACRLRKLGERVALVAMLDAYPADVWAGKPEPTLEDALVAMLDDVNASPIAPDGHRYTSIELLALLRSAECSLARFDEATLQRMARTSLGSMQQYRTARHEMLDADVLFFRAARAPADAPLPERWTSYVSGQLRVVDIDATHLAMCQAESLAQIGPWLRAALEPEPERHR